jgi:hypothetical protein
MNGRRQFVTIYLCYLFIHLFYVITTPYQFTRRYTDVIRRLDLQVYFNSLLKGERREREKSMQDK